MEGAITELHSIANARRHLPRLVRAVECGRPVQITRRGEPVAVLVGYRDFARIVAGRPGFGQAYAQFNSAFDLAELAIDPEEFLEGVRDAAPGRDVRL